MRKGCCCGCLVLLVLFIGWTGLGIYFAGHYMDLWVAAERVDTLAYVGEAPAVMVRIQPDLPEVTSILTEGFNGMSPEWLLPYEATLALIPTLEKQEVDVMLATSLRRFLGFLKLCLQSDEGQTALKDLDLDWRTTQQDGLLVLKTQKPIDEAVCTQVQSVWPQPRPGSWSGEGTHFLELVLDNRDGGVMLALDPFLVAREADPNEIVVMKAPFDLEGAGRLPGLFKRLNGLRFYMDLTGPDEAQCHVDSECRDAQAAETLLFFLFTLRDAVYRALVEQDIDFEGRLVRDGNRVKGTYTIRGYRAPLIEALQTRTNG